MSCTHTIFNAHLHSDKRSISHKYNHSTHREILSHPARFVELLRSLDIEWRSRVVKLAEKLDHTRVLEVSRDRDGHDHQGRSKYRQADGRTLRKECRSISSPWHDERRRPSQYNLTGSAHRQVPSRSPPLSSRNSRHSRHRDSESHFNPTSRQRQRTPSPSTLRGDPREFQDKPISSEYGTFIGHSLRRQGDRRVERSAPWQQPSTPGMSPFEPVPSSTYQHEPYVQSSRSQVNTTPVAVCHQAFPPESTLETASRRRSPSAPRRSIATARPRDHPSLYRPTSSTDLRRTPSGPERRIQSSLMMKDDIRFNSDPGTIDRPPPMSRDRPEPSRSQIYFRGRRSRPGRKSLKVEFMDGTKASPLIDRRMTSRMPKRTESSSSRPGDEERFTNLAYASWKRNGEYAQGEASEAHSKAQSLHDDLQCSPFQRLWLRVRSSRQGHYIH